MYMARGGMERMAFAAAPQMMMEDAVAFKGENQNMEVVEEQQE